MSRGAPVRGFDYRTLEYVERTRGEWREQLRTVVKAGGRRKVDAAPGETWAVDKAGRIVFEVYCVLPA